MHFRICKKKKTLPLNFTRTLVLGTLGAVGFSADVAKFKNHTMHSQPWTWHRNSIEKPQSQKYKFLKGVYPKFLRNTHFGKRHKKGLKNNAKAIKALVKPKKVKSKIPKSSSHKLNQLAYITHPKLEKHAYANIAKGLSSANQSPRPRLKPSPTLWLWLQLGLRLKLRLRLPWRLQSRGLCLPVWARKAWYDL